MFGLHSQQINAIDKTRSPTESDFRVHFMLMGVKWSKRELYENSKEVKLMEYISNVLS